MPEDSPETTVPSDDKPSNENEEATDDDEPKDAIEDNLKDANEDGSNEEAVREDARGEKPEPEEDDEEEENAKEKLKSKEIAKVPAEEKNDKDGGVRATQDRAKRRGTWLQRLFFGRNGDDKLKDPEAGVELLSKADLEKARIKRAEDVETTHEIKRDLDTSEKADVTAEIGADKEDPSSYGERRWQLWGFSRERLIVLGVAALSVVLILVVVLAVLTSGTVRRPVEFEGKYAETTTTCGLVQGVVEGGAVVFRGIPYALPPVGERRWRPSEAPGNAEECWKDVYPAHNHSRLCYQKPLPHPYGGLEFGEDCLYLDVYTPRLTYEDPMPVVVYFAGDSFQGHDVMDFKWRPSARLAYEKQVVFVVVYYRMNAFGFLALELLTKSVHPPTSGNYGLHDMLSSLKWVRQNIEGFGGNPAKVTVFGHGSGATGILALMSSSMGQMLFTQAWITGGSAHFVNKTLREVERNNEAFNRHLMCDTTECLYSKTPEQILSAIPTSEWPFWGVPNHLELPTTDEHTAAIPVVDGAILYDNPSVVWDENSFADVALVVGSSADYVGSRLMEEEFENFDWKKFNSTVRANLGTFGPGVAEDAIDLYYDENSTALQQYVKMVSDLRVTCPLLELAYRASKAFSNNVYFYLSSYVPDSIVEYTNLSNKMAVHGLDVAAAFGRIPEVLANPSERDLRYQRTVQELFYHFVRHGRLLPAANPKMPWNINWIGERLDSSLDPYPSYELWTKAGVYPKYARMN